VEKVGFVGLGIMGAAMAGNLLEAGHELVEQMFGVLEAKGRGGWDHSALLSLIEEGSG
jgi:3-hydroxyisobutyrate dehydrogenase-like beta-hydroxyacid dehydrogenase